MEFLRARKPTLSLDMAPLIDVVFQLLIFFMLTSSATSASMLLRLPKADTGDKQIREEITVDIDRSGTFYLRGAKVDPSALSSTLTERLRGRPELPIFIRGDRDMPYHFFVDVMDLARKSGARQIQIVHETRA